MGSFVVLWVLVIVLAIAVFALARQVGVLHARVAPAGALSPTSGPKVGETMEPVPTLDLAGQVVPIGGPNARRQLVLFVSPTCPVCKALVPVARSLARTEDLELVFASDGGDIGQHERYVDSLGLEDHRYVLSEALGITYGVAKLPFAVLIDSSGVLLSRGLVNTREHLESLLEAARLGFESIQDFVYDATKSDNGGIGINAADAAGGENAR